MTTTYLYKVGDTTYAIRVAFYGGRWHSKTTILTKV